VSNPFATVKSTDHGSGGSTLEAQIDVCYQAIDHLADLFDGLPVNNRVC
jgi:hypothetical protein